MKALLFTILTLATVQAHASYKPAVICGDRALVLDDAGTDRGGRHGQVVLKNEQIINYLISSEAIEVSDVNEKGEFIMRGNILGSNFFAGGNTLGAKGLNLLKKNDGYLLEIYENHYPKYPVLATFLFQDCREL